MSEYYIKMLNYMINIEIFERDQCIDRLEYLSDKFKKTRSCYFFTLDALWHNSEKTLVEYKKICKKIIEYRELLYFAKELSKNDL